MITAIATETCHLFFMGHVSPMQRVAPGLPLVGGLLDSTGRSLKFFGFRLPQEVTDA